MDNAQICRPRLHAIGPVKGLGSTAIACATLGIDFIGIEIDRSYLNEAVERMYTNHLVDADDDGAGNASTDC